MKNILVLGSGAREHAIAKKFQCSKYVKEVFVLPGNDGLKEEFEISQRDDFASILSYIKEKNINLVFVGNEQFLADGIVDYLEAYGVQIIGPTKAAARIESSKIFSKALMKRALVPTAFYESFSDINSALDFIKDKDFPIVIKADGLAAGKGVLIAKTAEEAERFLHDILSGKMFGSAGESIIIEEFLTGEEASIFAFCDGENFISTIFSQDHKRAYDHDEGLNTGGMGAFAPIDKFSHLKEKVDSVVITPILKAMKEEGYPFTGVLYAGLMIDGDEVNVIEFNCRFGDPETQVILPLLENDLFEICEAIIEKNIQKIKLIWKPEYAVCVVLASKGYPEFFQKGCEILIDKEIYNDKTIQLFFAGIKKDKNIYKNNGGRVISLVCIHDSLENAINHAYQKIHYIKSDILRYRTDIGKKSHL